MISAIHRQWKKKEGPHHQSLTGSSMTYAGTPDQYYEGVHGNAFCEYKFCKFRKLPVSIDVSKLLSAKQLAWLKRASKNGIACLVGIGYKDAKGKIRVAYSDQPVNWVGSIATEEYDWFTTEEAAEYIVNYVGVSA